MMRIGVQFEGLLYGDQLRLEHALFPPGPEPFMRRLLRRVLPTSLRVWLPVSRPIERRDTRRVQVIEDGELLVRAEPVSGRAFALGLAVVLEGAAPRPLHLCSLSATGCAYLTPAREAPTPGDHLELEVRGEGLRMKVKGRVVYAVQTVPSAPR